MFMKGGSRLGARARCVAAAVLRALWELPLLPAPGSPLAGPRARGVARARVRAPVARHAGGPIAGSGAGAAPGSRMRYTNSTSSLRFQMNFLTAATDSSPGTAWGAEGGRARAGCVGRGGLRVWSAVDRKAAALGGARARARAPSGCPAHHAVASDF